MNQDPFHNEADLQEDVGMFEAAVHAQPTELPVKEVRNVLLALDGSNQDATCRLLADTLASGGAQLHEVVPTGGAPEILESIRKHQADLVVLPTPFGRDFQALREESLGSVIDLLLIEAPCPVLCARTDLDAAGVQAALRDILIPVHVPVAEAISAVSWAAGLLRSGGNLGLLAVIDREALEEARRLLGSTAAAKALSNEALMRAVTDEMGGLTAAVQKLGTERGLGVQVMVKEGPAAETIVAEANRQARLLIVPAVRRHTAPAFHRAVDMILGSRGPVMFVGT